jgi:hypothetical protein
MEKLRETDETLRRWVGNDGFELEDLDAMTRDELLDVIRDCAIRSLVELDTFRPIARDVTADEVRRATRSMADSIGVLKGVWRYVVHHGLQVPSTRD